MSKERNRTDFKNAFYMLDKLDPRYYDPVLTRKFRSEEDKKIQEFMLSTLKSMRAKSQVLIFTTPHPPNFVFFVDVTLREEFKTELKAWTKNVVFAPEELMKYILGTKPEGESAL